MDVIPITRGSTFPVVIELFQDEVDGVRVDPLNAVIETEHSSFPFEITPTAYGTELGVYSFTLTDVQTRSLEKFVTYNIAFRMVNGSGSTTVFPTLRFHVS